MRPIISARRRSAVVVGDDRDRLLCSDSVWRGEEAPLRGRAEHAETFAVANDPRRVPAVAASEIHALTANDAERIKTVRLLRQSR